jgi:hypothetical protein
VKASDARKSVAARGKLLVHAGERILVIGRLHFLVASRSEPGSWHCVDLERVDLVWAEGGCTCQGFQVRKECRHVDAVYGWLASG